jgi:hypothetical protein
LEYIFDLSVLFIKITLPFLFVKMYFLVVVANGYQGLFTFRWFKQNRLILEYRSSPYMQYASFGAADNQTLVKTL